MHAHIYVIARFRASNDNGRIERECTARVGKENRATGEGRKGLAVVGGLDGVPCMGGDRGWRID